MTLYTSASGRAVNHVSSSSIDLYRESRKKFYYQKILGWKLRDRKASTEFGKVVESAIQFYFENGQKPGSAVEEFQRVWLKWDDQNLTYTDAEGNWADMYRTGKDLMRLFEITPLPIRNPKFQLCYEKLLFPGTQYGDLSFKAYVDILSTAEDGSRTVVDVKTANKQMSLAPNILSRDQQLRRYSWVSGITNVAFLQLVKARPTFRKGDSVTLLSETIVGYPAGSTLTIFKTCEDESFLVGSTEAVREMDEELAEIKGKGSGEKKDQAVAEALGHGRLFGVSSEDITRCKIQFVQATVPEDELAEIGQDIGNTALQIKQSVEQNWFPCDCGARWPNDGALYCSYRGLCLKDQALAEQMLVQITKPEPDWIDAMGDEE